MYSKGYVFKVSHSGKPFDLQHLCSDLDLRFREQIFDLTSDHGFDQICIRDSVYIISSDILRITEYGNPGSQAVHIFKTMGDEDNGYSVLFQFINDPIKLLGLILCQRGCRLIQNDDPCIGRKCFCNLHHLLLCDT